MARWWACFILILCCGTSLGADLLEMNSGGVYRFDGTTGAYKGVVTSLTESTDGSTGSTLPCTSTDGDEPGSVSSSRTSSTNQRPTMARTRRFAGWAILKPALRSSRRVSSTGCGSSEIGRRHS